MHLQIIKIKVYFMNSPIKPKDKEKITSPISPNNPTGQTNQDTTEVEHSDSDGIVGPDPQTNGPHDTSS